MLEANSTLQIHWTTHICANATGTTHSFLVGDQGDDVVTDFAADNDFERIDLSGVSAITDFTDLSANHISIQGLNVVIDTGGGNSITLNNVTLSDLGDVDFVW